MQSSMYVCEWANSAIIIVKALFIVELVVAENICLCDQILYKSINITSLLYLYV